MTATYTVPDSPAPDPLRVFCPLCLARPGEPCADVSTPNGLRVRAAEEVAR